MVPFRSTVRSLIVGFRQRKLIREAKRKAEAHRRLAIQINDLASRIHSEADTSELVHAIGSVFSRELPPAWTARSVHRRIARAELETADPLRLIPEQRIAEIWNDYVREISAPDETLVRAAEIHDLRDAG